MRITIKAKLAVTFAVVVLLAAGAMLVAIQDLGSLDSSFNNALNGNVKRIALAEDTDSRSLKVAQSEKAIILASTSEDIDRYSQEIASQASAMADDLSKLREMSPTDEDKARIDSYEQQWGSYMPRDSETQKLARQNSTVRARTIEQNEGAAAFAALLEPLDTMLGYVGAVGMPSASDLTAAVALGDLKDSLNSVRIMALDMMAASDDAAQQKKYNDQIDSALASLQTARQKVHSLPGVSTELATTLDQRISAWLEIYANYRQIALENGEDHAIALVDGDGAKARETAASTIDDIVKAENDELAATSESNGNLYESSRLLLIGLTIGLVLIAAAAATWIVMGISSGLAKVRRVLDAVSLGDLEQRVTVTTNDEIKDLIVTVNGMTDSLKTSAQLADTIANGDLTIEPKPLSEKDMLGLALKRMVERLREVISDALASAQNVSAGSQELSATAEQLSQGATEQASSTEVAPTSLDERAATIKQSADNAGQT